ncbi:MAG: PorT family protein [Bacteroidales bacterium]|nr:PorT family protein [Bacteroidales bacterium]
MKNELKYLLIVSLLLALSSPLSAQRFKGAVMGGMNLSQVDGDEVYGYKRVGGHFGLAAILPIKKWDITLETIFNQKGAREKQQYTLYDSTENLKYTGEYNLRLNYVEVPLMAHYTDRERYTAGLGFSYGRLVSSSEIEHGDLIPPYSDTVEFNKNDFNILVDLQIRVWKQLKFNIRFAYSLIPIRERTFYDIFYKTDPPWTRKQYNNMLTFRLVYVINEKVPERKVKQ